MSVLIYSEEGGKIVELTDVNVDNLNEDEFDDGDLWNLFEKEMDEDLLIMFGDLTYEGLLADVNKEVGVGGSYVNIEKKTFKEYVDYFKVWYKDLME